MKNNADTRLPFQLLGETVDLEEYVAWTFKYFRGKRTREDCIAIVLRTAWKVNHSTETRDICVEHPATYMQTALNHECADEYKEFHRSDAIDPLEYDKPVEDIRLEAVEAIDHYTETVAEIADPGSDDPDDQKRCEKAAKALYLKNLGYTYAEIATTMQTDLSDVKVLLRTADRKQNKIQERTPQQAAVEHNNLVDRAVKGDQNAMQRMTIMSKTAHGPSLIRAFRQRAAAALLPLPFLSVNLTNKLREWAQIPATNETAAAAAGATGGGVATVTATLAAKISGAGGATKLATVGLAAVIGIGTADYAIHKQESIPAKTIHSLKNNQPPTTAKQELPATPQSPVTQGQTVYANQLQLERERVERARELAAKRRARALKRKRELRRKRRAALQRKRKREQEALARQRAQISPAPQSGSGEKTYTPPAPKQVPPPAPKPQPKPEEELDPMTNPDWAQEERPKH